MKYARSLVLIFLVALGVFAWRFFAVRGPDEPATQSQVSNDPTKAALFPQQRDIAGYALTIYAPQVREWPEFKRFISTIAFALTRAGDDTPQYGTATVSGDTSVDLDRRIVTIRSPKVTDVTFVKPVPAASTAAVMDAATRESLDVRLDLFLAYLADDVLAADPPPGFNMSPPPIFVRSSATALLFVDGAPVLLPVPGTNVYRVVNANWPLLQDRGGGGTYYLLVRDGWLTSGRLEHGWAAATSLPPDFARLPSTEEYGAIRSAVPLRKFDDAPPAVVFAYRPSELVVIDGKPSLETIPATDGLQWVTNTASPLFKLDSNWYLLAAGRWFTTADLDKGPWAFAKELPKAFAVIPEDHPRATVRASVPGTIEARMSALEAAIPRTKRVASGSTPPVEINYAGDPQFETIPGTLIARAVNSGFDVFMYQDRFYLCYAAVWYVSASPLGPWRATADVPQAIYTIPPESPAYNVTDVEASASSADEIEYTSTDAYEDGVYVAYGTAWYGTGWYYPPYIYGPIYFPFWGSYGHGSWYNPVTGRYGSKSIWYGPYGGYSYTQGYNPRTGRYGYVETAWDGDEWASFGETYNPRTGLGVKTERTRDFYDGTSTVERETSLGGQSSVHRSREGGSITSERSLTTASGDSYAVSSEQSRSHGSSTITGTGGTVTTSTVRNDGRSATVIEGSGGGQALSMSDEDLDRLTVGQSSGGDVYAGYNGNIYKKTSDGWQRLDNGTWRPAESSSYVARERPAAPPKIVPAAPAASSSAPTTAAQSVTTSANADYAREQAAQNARARAEQQAREERERAQLERDYEARERGDRQFRQRAVQRGGGSRRR